MQVITAMQPLNLIGASVTKTGAHEARYSQETLQRLAHDILKARKDDEVNIREYQGSMVKGEWFGDSPGVVACALSRGLINRGETEKKVPLNLPAPEGFTPVSWKQVSAIYVYEEETPPPGLKALFDKAVERSKKNNTPHITLYDTDSIHEKVYLGVSDDLVVAIGKTASAVYKYMTSAHVNIIT